MNDAQHTSSKSFYNDCDLQSKTQLYPYNSPEMKSNKNHLTKQLKKKWNLRAFAVGWASWIKLMLSALKVKRFQPDFAIF
jgi:hypothetical protein